MCAAGQVRGPRPGAFLREVVLGALRVPYHLVPASGVLAKPSKWSKLPHEALVADWVTPAAITALHHSALDFVSNLVAQVED